MKKKMIGLLMAILLCLNSANCFADSATAAKSSADFTDLKDLDAATKAKFDAMISAGIFDGISDTTFGLKDEMNRAQYAKVAALTMELDVNKDLKTSSFSDVKVDGTNGYALPYIEALLAAGITNGNGNGTYNPAGKVTKEQLATFLVRILGKDADAKATTGGSDSTVSDWAKGYVALALELKLLPNEADGKFGGQTNATRDSLLTGAYEAKQQYVPIRAGAAMGGSTAVAAVAPAVPIAVAETPTADLSSGDVDSGTQVSLSATQGATIYYTTDGSTPTIDSTPYSSPITITKSVTIKAIAVKYGWINSSVASFKYTIPIELPESIESTSQLVVGKAYTGSVAASGGAGDITYTVTSGQLPPGLDLDPNTGEITGSLSSSGTYSFTISATDSAATPAIASMPYVVTIAPPAPTLTHLTSNPANVMLTAIGATEALAIMAFSNNDTSLNVTGETQYKSNDESVATVSAEGIVTAVANGTTNIVVTYGGLTKNVPVLVTAARQLESIYASLSSVSLAVGTTANITVSAFFDDYSAEGAAAWATFEIEDPDLATIDANGYLTALKPGRTKIKVKFLSEEFITDELIIWE